MKKFLIFYFLFCFSFFSFFASGVLDSQDGLQYLTIARRIYYDHTFEMPVENYANGTNLYMNTVEGKESRIYAITGLGFSLAYLPAVFLEDVFLHLAGLEPISAFPLQNDWPVLLFASMTNTVFASLLVTIIYLYLRALNIKHQSAIFLSFFTFIVSNLFPYAKYSFAHMMFTSFLMLTFYLIKKYSQTKNSLYLLGAGATFGVMMISYNQTFVFAIPTLAIYYFLLSKIEITAAYFKKLLRNMVYGLCGILPFFLIYICFGKLRFHTTEISEIASKAQALSSKIPPTYVIFEGIWGLLFSAGKSIFLFTPSLLILIIFWFKLSKKILPEIIAAITLFLTYLWLIGTYLGGETFLVWHGDSSWGPRYMLPILPLFLILISYIYTKLNLKQKLFIFWPLAIIGLAVNLLGVLLPYQIRYRDVPPDTWIGGIQFKASDYGNFIPRYSPVFNMSKIFGKRVKQVQKNWGKNIYNLQLRDGFDQPFDMGWTVWRGMRSTSAIGFNNDLHQPIKTLSVQIKNHQIEPTSVVPASFNFYVNGQKIEAATSSAKLPINQEQEFKFNFSQTNLKLKNNILQIQSEFEGTASAYLDKKQALFLQILRINNLPQNIEEIHYPYVSQFSQKVFNLEYDYWGKIEQDPWAIWHMHSIVYENTFDLWWLKLYHYWDLPKDFFAILFVINVGGILYYGYKTWFYQNKDKKL